MTLVHHKLFSILGRVAFVTAHLWHEARGRCEFTNSTLRPRYPAEDLQAGRQVEAHAEDDHGRLPS